MLGHYSLVSAQESLVFYHQQSQSAYPISLIDSITLPRNNEFNIYSEGNTIPRVVPTDSLMFNVELPDTLMLTFHEDYVEVCNPHLEYIEVLTKRTTVNVRSYSKKAFVCLSKGVCSDGRVVIDADTACTLILSDLHLSSEIGSAICLKQKQKARIVLADGTTNTLKDAQKYNLSDSTDTSNGCIYAKGSLTFTGSGTLNISGNYRHAIVSSKNITIEDGKISIIDTRKDGIHCDKYKQIGGTVSLHLSQMATKGIKVKEEFEMKDGRIEGEALGDLKISDDDTSYCTFIKSDSLFTMVGGVIALKHTGKGGRCISVDRQMVITGGVLNMECHGDGGSYLTATNDFDYYTPKCIIVDESLRITGGTITCLSTGLGGKGIVSGKYLAIGCEGSEEGPLIRVETKGDCILNNEDEDQRFGCPKGIKADEELHIYCGDIAVSTAGMGGEGVECNGELFIHGGILECNTFDDGINVGHAIEISGGCVYCNSEDNDGIDSNGSITVSGGIVASVNQLRPNESFDAENGQLYLLGGIIFGIGSAPVIIGKSGYPCYSSSNDSSGEYYDSRGLILTEGKYVNVRKGDELVMSLRNDNRAFRSYLTLMAPSFTEAQIYTISESECPLGAKSVFFSKILVLGGEQPDYSLITDIQVLTIQ